MKVSKSHRFFVIRLDFFFLNVTAITDANSR